MTITGVKLTKFPPTKPNGNRWDYWNNSPRDRADLQFVISTNNSAALFVSSIIEDANAANIQTWGNLHIVIEEPNQEHKLVFYDIDDLPGNGYGNKVGEIKFTPYTYTPNEPPTFLAIGNNKIDLLIDVEYNW